VLVVAAGNDRSDVSGSAPANCRGALAVAASNISGSLADWFSNRGLGVAISAPGESIYSTGTVETGAGPSGPCYKSGTSMATPHVVAAVALLQAAQPTLTVSQAHLAIRAGARAFPSGSNCPGLLCGAGLLDARGSLDAVVGNSSRIGWNEQSATVLESDGSVSFSLARVGNIGQAVSVSVATVDGSATSGVDFGAVSPATVSWAAGDVADKTITVPIVHRAGEQSSRDFAIAITTPSSGASVVLPNTVGVHINDVDCATVTPIAIGQSLAGDLGLANTTYCHSGVRGQQYNTVRYSFSGSAGDVVGFDVRSTTALPSVLDPYVYLLSPNRTILAENDDIQSGVIRDSRILQFVLPTTGTHYIDVTTWSPTVDASGTFNIRLFGCGDYVPGPTCNVDIDGDGLADRTDGLLLLRRMMGVTGAALTDGVQFRTCAIRTTEGTIAPFVDSQMNSANLPMPFDIDGDDKVLATTDGLMLVRALLGLSGTGVVNKATVVGAPRVAWSDVRGYLTQQCGMTLPP
jgi:hypothetical protein